MSLTLSAFENALARLQEGLGLYARDISQAIVRDGLMQRFEFTYELAHKMLKRALEEASASPEQYDKMSFASLVRSGNEQGLLLGGWPQWKHYRDMRARTSHTCKEATALEVVADIPAFLRGARSRCGASLYRNRTVARASAGRGSRLGPADGGDPGQGKRDRAAMALKMAEPSARPRPLKLDRHKPRLPLAPVTR